LPEIVAALDALAVKVNLIATAVNDLTAKMNNHGLIASAATWTLCDARTMVTFGFVNPDADTYAAGLMTLGMWDAAT